MCSSDLVSSRVAADPFKKVKEMIKDLISKLTQEAEQKGWCDIEVTTNTQTRNKNTEEVKALNGEIEDLTATIAQLTQDHCIMNVRSSRCLSQFARQVMIVARQWASGRRKLSQRPPGDAVRASPAGVQCSAVVVWQNILQGLFIAAVGFR